MEDKYRMANTKMIPWSLLPISLLLTRHRNVMRKNQGVIDAHEKTLRDVR